MLMPVKSVVSDLVWKMDDDGGHLIGSRCVDCDNHVFPTTNGCSRCTGSNMEDVALATEGTLWTWTIQGYPPKAPPYAGDVENFQPFGVGYVELPGQCKIESRLTVADPEQLSIGMQMKMTTATIGTDDEGNELVTFAFAPVA